MLLLFHCHSKNVFFFLENEVDFLSSEHMRLWVSLLLLWRVDKTEADPGERVQNSWQEAHVQYANIYGVTSKLKLHTAIYIIVMPRPHRHVLCGRQYNVWDT